MTSSIVTQNIELAHAIKETTGATDPVELREAVNMLGRDLMGSAETDVTVDLDGHSWRFIRASGIDEIMQKELKSDTYFLGCFNSGFLAGILGVDADAIASIQKSEAFDGLGQLILAGGHLEELQEAYASADGYGHHFASYDGDGHEMHLKSGEMIHAFNCG